MRMYRNETHEFLNQLSDEEFFKLLEEAGFEVGERKGNIIFTENDDDSHRE